MYAENLKLIRKTLNLSASELSEKIGIPARTIGGYERRERKMSLETVTQMCKILNINANWFVLGEGEMFRSKQLSFTEKILDIQHKYSLTDAQAADILNISETEFKAVLSEEKQPDIGLLKNIKKHFNVSIDWLLES